MAVAEATAPVGTTDLVEEEGVAPGGLAGLLGTGDHVAVGRLFLVTSVLFLLVTVVAAVLEQLEAVDVSDALFSGQTAPAFASMHVTAGAFLFAIPAFLGLAISIVPLQIGASTVAFPRAATAAFWGWFFSGVVLLASYAVQFGPAGLDPTKYNGRLLWLVGLGGVLVSLTLATICVLTTLWALRTAGMGLDRVPYFSWSMLVAGSVWLATLPVLLALTVLGYIAARYEGAVAGDVSFERLAVAWGTPGAFAWSVPLLGVLLDSAGTAARARFRMHGPLLGMLTVYALLTFPAGFAVAFGEGGGSPVFQDFLYVVGSWVGAVVLLAFFGGVADGLRRGGRPKLRAPLVVAVFSVLALLLGEGLNAARVVDNLDLTGTTADIGVAHLAWVAGLLGVLAGLHHWSTKVFGFVLRDGLGYLAGLCVLGGGVVTGAAHFVAALEISSIDDDTREALNGTVALIGWGLLALGVLVFLVNLAGSAAASRSGDAAPDDPWDGLTLEWATASPPVPGGPGPLEPVTSPTPLLDTKEEVVPS